MNFVFVHMIRFTAIVISLTLLLCSCDSDSQDPETLLINKWVDSREENNQNSNSRIYRPSDYKEFPFSMYRQSFKFSENGICEYLVLSPVDAHYIAQGTWHFDGNVITIIDMDEEIVHSLNVISISENKLLLAY